MREKMTNTCNKCACNKVCNHDVFGFENCGNFIPAADVVEVVRCKDCEYAKEYKNNLFCCYYPRAPKSVSSNDYCSYGIRKDGNENAE